MERYSQMCLGQTMLHEKSCCSEEWRHTIHQMLTGLESDVRIQGNSTYICQPNVEIIVGERSPLRCNANNQEKKTPDQAERRCHLDAVSRPIMFLDVQSLTHNHALGSSVVGVWSP